MTPITVWLILTAASLPGIVKPHSSAWHFEGENIALGKETSQGPNTEGNMVSRRAVDGNTNGNTSAGFCAHPNGTNRAYWTVDLGGDYILKGIRIYNRVEQNLWGRNEALKIIGNPNNTTVHDEKTANPKLYNNSIIDVPIYSTAQFSSITIEIPPSGSPPFAFLTLCEVEIYYSVDNCSIISNPPERSWHIRSGTGDTDTAKETITAGSVIEFTCIKNFKLNGTMSLLCMSSGSYDKDAPTCTEIRCNAPSDIANGEYIQQLIPKYPVDSVLTWQCKTGYRSEQNKERVCTNTTGWSGEQPMCYWITCPFPGTVSNGELKRNDGTTVYSGPISNRVSLSISCDVGHQTNVQNTTCTLEGQWDAIPDCQQVTCDSLGQLTGGYYSYNSNMVNNQVYIYGTIAIPICNERLYKLGKSTEKNLTCGQNGEWTGGSSGCVALCEQLLLPNGNYTGLDNSTKRLYDIGEYIVPHCDEGFQLGTSSVMYEVLRTCQADHTWDGPNYRCETIEPGIESTSSETCSYLLIPVAAGIPGAFMVGFAIGIAVMCILSKRKKISSKPQQHPDINATYCTPNRDMIDEGHVYLEVNEVLDG